MVEGRRDEAGEAVRTGAGEGDLRDGAGGERWEKARSVAEGDDSGGEPVPGELSVAKFRSRNGDVRACDVDDNHGQ